MPRGFQRLYWTNKVSAPILVLNGLENLHYISAHGYCYLFITEQPGLPSEMAQKLLIL